MLYTLFLIWVFGIAGISLRYCLDLWIPTLISSPFPVSTFFINIFGSFMIGIVYVLGIQKGFLGLETRIAITTGFLGGFTTFSSYALASLTLLEAKHVMYSVCYFVLSPVFGLIAAWLGTLVAQKIPI